MIVLQCRNNQLNKKIKQYCLIPINVILKVNYITLVVQIDNVHVFINTCS